MFVLDCVVVRRFPRLYCFLVFTILPLSFTRPFPPHWLCRDQKGILNKNAITCQDGFLVRLSWWIWPLYFSY